MSKIKTTLNGSTVHVFHDGQGTVNSVKLGGDFMDITHLVSASAKMRKSLFARHGLRFGG